jgi:hypothetical protein
MARLLLFPLFWALVAWAAVTPATFVVGALLVVAGAAMSAPLMLLPGSPTEYTPSLWLGVAAAMAGMAIRQSVIGRPDAALAWGTAALNFAGFMTAIWFTMWSFGWSWT